MYPQGPRSPGLYTPFHPFSNSKQTRVFVPSTNLNMFFISCPISRIVLSGRDGLGGEAAQNAHPNPGKQTIQVTNLIS